MHNPVKIKEICICFNKIGRQCNKIYRFSVTILPRKGLQHQHAQLVSGVHQFRKVAKLVLHQDDKRLNIVAFEQLIRKV